MAGAVSVVVVGSSSSLINSKACLCNFNGGDLMIVQRHSIGWKNVARLRPLDLCSSFLDYSSMSALWVATAKKRKKRRENNKSLVVVDELAGQYEENFEDVKKQIVEYFTYKAVRTVLNQLYEMNPPQYQWFYNYIASNEHGYGKRFVRNLVKDKLDLAERVMITRLHLYGKWIKKCDHTEMYERISDQNLELMRERLMETVIWPSDDTNTETMG
ncbi:hypothetical protein ABFS82_04G059200 [Erythranthe guttata]|uniref:Chaperonin-like RbcX protein n=1 Tax=Erythranthe guttata TaxID=4155 RepID=A0A022S0F5_ERYGU|nr:PREDICTED: uncharacterized protein LOC105949834 [Erythranthe guttata]EYU46257.1 hypothetical protein MIMGU_mgv1a022704mg [Erythranthe guttata]|eukprot:XP_012828627.1 PREDICTED: uncharacterized protein LOC105949834 [Erythranthe guttata]